MSTSLTRLSFYSVEFLALRIHREFPHRFGFCRRDFRTHPLTMAPKRKIAVISAKYAD